MTLDESKVQRVLERVGFGAKLQKLSRGIDTAVYISHRLSSTKFCDAIAVFAGGEIVEYGTHEELMENGGLYKELFQMQAQFYV